WLYSSCREAGPGRVGSSWVHPCAECAGHRLRRGVLAPDLTRRRSMSRVLALVATVSAFASGGFAQVTAFTYQGRLQESGALANGPHDFRFRLYDAATGGTLVGNPVCVDNAGVTGGLFTVQVDFGPQYATTAPRFLEIDVRTDTGLNCLDATGFVTLSPRQQI